MAYRTQAENSNWGCLCTERKLATVVEGDQKDPFLINYYTEM